MTQLRVARNWAAVKQDGSTTAFHVVTTLDDRNSYRMSLYRDEAGERLKLFEMPFRRVDKAPGALRRMRGEE